MNNDKQNLLSTLLHLRDQLEKKNKSYSESEQKTLEAKIDDMQTQINDISLQTQVNGEMLTLIIGLLKKNGLGRI